MGPNFSPVIAFSGDQLIAMGPLGSDDLRRPDYVEELRAWIYQPVSFNVNVELPGETDARTTLWSPNDAAADSSDESALRQNAGVCWMLPLTRISAASFNPGRAFAVAIALISNGAPSGERKRSDKLGRVIWWGHPIRLIGTSEANKVVNGVFKDLEDGIYEDDNNTEYFLQLERRLQDMAENPDTTT